ncbi:hypothetical protein HNQ07_003782 [Deinococcus metalli]|uniref:DUF4180 domain-containing protein n=1 Tax=Deinococcus metalli TaxID=1141878 RepID=A0A7W8KHH7_9DEIO|nr:DUF4180 domain-containing protein [Deinococcus metalli]MBB5378281.1 hypothetical protein [Deinococcus metalli]GHF57396.1 hypothetical protein GCM10017781_37200 [Deinococcus metalli]
MMKADEVLRIAMARDLGLPVLTWAEVNTVVGAALGVRGVIFTEADVAPEFFRLGSGLAGEVFQKFTNYRVAVALVVPDPAAHGERFEDLVREHRRHPLIRIVQGEAEARAWLESLP